MEKNRLSHHDRHDFRESSYPTQRPTQDESAFESPKSSRYERRMKFKTRDQRRDWWDDDDY